MAKLIFLTIGFSLLGIFISGFLPGRRVDVEKGKSYAIGIGKNILFYVKGIDLPWFLSYLPLFWPLTRIFIPLEWDEIIEDTDRANELIDGTTERKFKKAEILPKSPGKFLGKRKQLVPFLLDYEPVDYRIDKIKDKDGHGFTLDFSLLLWLKSPNKTIGKPDFKMLGKNELANGLRAWAVQKSLEEIYGTNTAALKDPECGIAFAGNVDMETFLNDKIFGPLGVEIELIQLAEVVPDTDTDEIFQLKRTHADIGQKIKNTEELKKLKEIEGKIALAEAKVQAKIANIEFTNYLEPIGEVIEKIYNGQANVAAQHPNVLAESHGQADQTGPAIVKELFEEIKRATSKNAGKATASEEGGSKNAAA